MSELLKKYESIDQSKLNEATIKIINRVKTITADFTADDEKNNKIAEQVLDSVMQKNPDAVKIVKREPKAKPAPKKTHKATHTAKATHKATSAPATKNSDNNIMTVAKQIQNAGESWKDAMERAKVVLKQRKEKVVEKKKTELEKLYALVKTKKELQGFANSDIKRDAVREAKVKGARFVSKEGSTSNAYGTFPNKIGRKYWETRDRHSDRLAPNYPKDMPLLAKGGGVDSRYVIRFEDSKGNKESMRTDAYNKAEAMKVGKFFEGKAQFKGFKVVSVSEIEEEFANGGSTKKYRAGQKFYDTRYDRVCEIVPSNYEGMVSWKRYNKSGTEFENDTQHSLVEDQFDYLVNMGAYQISKQSMAKGGMLKVEDSENGYKNLLGFEPYFEKDVTVASFSEKDKIVRPSQGYFYPNPMAKKVIRWAKKNGYEFIQDGKKYADGGMLKVEDSENGYKNLLGFEPYFEKDVTVASFSEKDKIVRPSQGYFYPNPMAKKVISWAKKNGYEFIQDGKKYADGGSLPFMTDPNFGNFQNTGSFADGGSMSDLTEQEFLKKYFGANVFTENPSQYFEIKKMSSSDDNKVDAFVKELKSDGFTVKKRAFSDFTSVMGVKKKASFELGGAFMMTDLAGHTGGSDGLGNPMPLSGVTGTNYTGLVGETGAMSSGELFEDGGSINKNFDLSGWTRIDLFENLAKAKEYVDDYKKGNPYFDAIIIRANDKKDYFIVYARLKKGKSIGNRVYEAGGAMMQNQQVIDDASQSYVNYYLGEGASQGIYKDGGSIPNNYEGRTPEDVWTNLTIEQRKHFLFDHQEELPERFTGYYVVNELAKRDFDNSPKEVQFIFGIHVETGQYASGGSLGKALYVEWSSWFVSNKYDEEKIMSVLQSIGAKNIRLENDRGWSNQPEVVVFNGDKNKAQDALNEAFDTDYIRVREKDWRTKKMADGGSVGDDFEEVIDLGSEQYYTRPFGIVESESKGEVELVAVATIRDLEDYMSEDELPEEGNFQLEITLVPTEQFISEEILESANDEDSSVSDNSEINLVNYAGGLNYSPQERVFFESHQDALDYLMSDELKEQINRDSFSSDYIMYKKYNRIGQTNSEYLDYLMGVTERFDKGGSVDDSVIDELWNGYASALLFTETDSDSGEPLDSEYSISDFDKETVASSKKMLAEYYSKNKEAIEESELDLDTIGNDIWYTRSGQGAGFFDHSLDEEVEEKLTKGAKELGEYPSVETYDGKISVRGGKVFAKGGFVGTVEFNAGDTVWQKDEKRYATVMDNYGDPVNGSGGDIRLDTSGNTPIFTYDKKTYENTGYNLVKVGDKGDTGKFTPKVLADMKASANRLINSRKERKDTEMIKYYEAIYKRLLDGEFDSMVGRAKATTSTQKGSSDYTYVPNKDVKELSVVLKGELKKLMGSDILDGVYVKNSAKSAPKADADAVFAKILKDAKEAKYENGKTKRFDASELKILNLEMIQKLVEAGYTEQQIRNVIFGYTFDNEVLAEGEFDTQSGIFGYEDSYVPKKTDSLVEAKKNNEFAVGIEYPDFDWQGIIKKYKISSKPKELVIERRAGSWGHTEYFYEVFVGENIVIGHNYGYKDFDANGKLKNDYIDKTKKVTDPTKQNAWQKEREVKAGFNSGWWTVVSSKIEIIDDVLKTLLSQKGGYCKELDFYDDSFPKNLKENNIDFELGGFMNNVYAKGGGVSDYANSPEYKEMVDKMQKLTLDVKGRVVRAIGLDSAIEFYDSDLPVRPYQLLERAVKSGFITLDEINERVVDSAMETAEDSEDDEEVGSSDFTSYLHNFLDDAGFKVKYVGSKLTREFADGGFMNNVYAKGGNVAKSGYAIMQRGELRTDAYGKVEFFDTKEKALFKMSHVPNFKSLTKEEKLKLIVPYTKDEKFADGGFMNNVYAKGGSTNRFVIVEGFDSFKNRPLYQVVDKSEQGEYVGEYHTNRKDAEEELKDLQNSFADGGGVEDVSKSLSVNKLYDQDGNLMGYTIKDKYNVNGKYTLSNTKEKAEEVLQYLIDNPSRLAYYRKNEYANGGEMQGNNIDAELEDFDIDNLDPFETMQYNQFVKSSGKVGALQVLINSVEGNYSELSPELAELAEKQMSGQEWEEQYYRDNGYADGGDVDDEMYKLAKSIVRGTDYKVGLYLPFRTDFYLRDVKGRLGIGSYLVLQDIDNKNEWSVSERKYEKSKGGYYENIKSGITQKQAYDIVKELINSKFAKGGGIEFNVEKGDVFKITEKGKGLPFRVNKSHRVTSVSEYFVNYELIDDYKEKGKVTLSRFKKLIEDGDIFIFPKNDTSFSKKLNFANGGSFEDNYGFMKADNENNYRFPERPIHVDTLDEPIDLTDNVSYKPNEVVIESVDQDVNMNEDGRIRARMTQSNRGSAENFAKINPNAFEFIPMPTSNKHKND